MDYLARYINGEYEVVWNELRFLAPEKKNDTTFNATAEQLRKKP